MTMNKRSKNGRYRGSKTHGCGSMKKRRGAGNRGGRGAAGSGKRADQKKPVIWKGKYFGKVGFKTPQKEAAQGINVGTLDQCVGSWVAAKRAEEKSGVFVVDLTKLGYGKLLGSGSATHKFKITVDAVSPSAAEKIKDAGGEVVSQVKEEAVQEAKQEAPQAEQAAEKAE